MKKIGLKHCVNDCKHTCLPSVHDIDKADFVWVRKIMAHGTVMVQHRHYMDFWMFSYMALHWHSQSYIYLTLKYGASSDDTYFLTEPDGLEYFDP